MSPRRRQLLGISFTVSKFCECDSGSLSFLFTQPCQGLIDQWCVARLRLHDTAPASFVAGRLECDLTARYFTWRHGFLSLLCVFRSAAFAIKPECHHSSATRLAPPGFARLRRWWRPGHLLFPISALAVLQPFHGKPKTIHWQHFGPAAATAVRIISHRTADLIAVRPNNPRATYPNLKAGRLPSSARRPSCCQASKLRPWEHGGRRVERASGWRRH